MLSALLEGSEASEIILIRDCVDQPGRALLKCFTIFAAKRFERVCLFSLDFHPDSWLHGLDKEIILKIQAFDGYSKPLSWMPQSDSDSGYPLVRFSESLDLCGLLECHCPNGLKGRPAVVIIDSLSPLLTHFSAPFTCQTLNGLQQRKRDGCHVAQIVCLVHSDLHDESDITALNYISSTVITSEDKAISSGKHVSEFSGKCEVTHKRKSGKVIKMTEHYTIDKLWKLTSVQSPRSPHIAPAEDTTSTSDPAANLTFNLRLSEQEREARSSVVLPYTYTAMEKAVQLSGKPDTGGQIFYQPDGADDIDEEDPDDDLDI